MLRLALFAVVFAVSAVLAHAQSNRERLEGFFKVPFGAGFAQTKQTFGTGVSEGTWVSEDKSIRLKTLTHHDRELRVGGKSHFVTYYFGAGDRLLGAAFVSKFQVTEEDDLAACFKTSAVMRDLQARYGPPDSQRERDDALHFVFAFKDGNAIEAKLETEDEDCELRVVYRNADGRKIKLFDD